MLSLQLQKKNVTPLPDRYQKKVTITVMALQVTRYFPTLVFTYNLNKLETMCFNESDRLTLKVKL